MENHLLVYQEPFHLEIGHTLPSIKICYSTFGKLNDRKDNVVWICHALTANSNASSWWPGLVGSGKIFNPENHFIVCANVLGSCYGTTGPLDLNPLTGKPYFHNFPQVTIRDMVMAHNLLKNHLGIQQIYTCIGGSLGGQQALEWSICFPNLIQNLVLLATNAFHSPWGIAFNEAQRMAIKADATWKDDSEHAGREGLRAARSLALLSYRNYITYQHTQSETDISKVSGYKASSYQNYQGDKLVNRFNCHSYISLSHAMDSHHVGRNRGSISQALSGIISQTLLIGITSDLLFPPQEQIFLSETIANAQYHEIDSLYGHDGFLIETLKIAPVIDQFLDSKPVKALKKA